MVSRGGVVISLPSMCDGCFGTERWTWLTIVKMAMTPNNKISSEGNSTYPVLLCRADP